MRAVRVCCAVLTLVLARPALAAGPAATPAAVKPADREAARALATRGYELFQAGSYQEAIESFRKAEEKVHAPPHLLYIARSQVKLRQLVEAKDTFREMLAEKLAPDAPYPFKDAQTSARAELNEVDILIPSMSLTLEGKGADKAEVLFDGKPFPRVSLGKPVPENPGLHTITVTVPGEPPVERTILLKQGTDVEQVTLDISPSRSRVGAPAIVTFVVGGAAVATGGTLLGLYFAKPELKTTGVQIASIGSLAGGGALLGTGTLLVLLRSPAAADPAPKASRRTGPRVQIGVGPGSISLSGQF